MKKILPYLLLFVFLSNLALAQDVHFSQFYETPLFRNPALAGIVNGDVRAQTVYRSQWNSVANAYKTVSANAEYKMPVGSGDNYTTIALQLYHDKAGTTGLTSTQVMPALNFHKSLSGSRNVYLSAGFMGGIMQRSFDRSKITTNNQYEGGGDGETFDNTSYSYFDGSVGLSLNSEFGNSSENNYVVGIAYHHFTKPRNSFYSNSEVTLSPKYVLSAGLRFNVNDFSLLTIEADHSRQEAFQETIAGMMYTLSIGGEKEGLNYSLSAGTYLRWNDALIPTFKLNYPPFGVGMSYDVNISRLKNSSYGRGGFEMSLTYVGFFNRNNSSLNAVHCPRF